MLSLSLSTEEVNSSLSPPENFFKNSNDIIWHAKIKFGFLQEIRKDKGIQY